jgi:hypothetical protein
MLNSKFHSLNLRLLSAPLAGLLLLGFLSAAHAERLPRQIPISSTATSPRLMIKTAALMAMPDLS